MKPITRKDIQTIIVDLTGLLPTEGNTMFRGGETKALKLAIASLQDLLKSKKAPKRISTGALRWRVQDANGFVTSYPRNGVFYRITSSFRGHPTYGDKEYHVMLNENGKEQFVDGPNGAWRMKTFMEAKSAAVKHYKANFAKVK